MQFTIFDALLTVLASGVSYSRNTFYYIELLGGWSGGWPGVGLSDGWVGVLVGSLR